MKLSNFILPPWVKFVPYLAIVGLLVALMLTRGTLDDTKVKLDHEISWRGDLAGMIGFARNTPPAALKDALFAELMTGANATAALERISREAEEAKKRADAADAALKREQAENERRFAAAQRTITELQNRKSTGTAAGDLAVIEQDSQAAWKGWK